MLDSRGIKLQVANRHRRRSCAPPSQDGRAVAKPSLKWRAMVRHRASGGPRPRAEGCECTGVGRMSLPIGLALRASGLARLRSQELSIHRLLFRLYAEREGSSPIPLATTLLGTIYQSINQWIDTSSARHARD